MKKRYIRWLIVAVVRPCIMFWIFVEGLPGVIRAIGSAVATVVRAFQR